MNILYLHGLQSKLNSEKRSVLESYGKVFAPNIDYSKNNLQARNLITNLKDTEINVIVGSSMGALNAYAISDLIGRPALLFNPPLMKYNGTSQQLLPKYTKGSSFKLIVLGAQDPIVDPRDTLLFLSHRLKEHELQINIDPKLAHRIPIELFRNQVKHFFDQLCY